MEFRPGWNSNLDINKDEVINIMDMYIAALNYGWTQHCQIILSTSYLNEKSVSSSVFKQVFEYKVHGES